ncbi:hypothetical protein BDR07DRAFT_317343 [Suillus spraguei]|nr:hypothetical protein BDR07DRAFT_317343 [Suillus spraguei]
MEPISSSVAVLPLIESLAQASTFMYRYVASVRNADASYQTLLILFSPIIGILTIVMEIRNDPFLPENLRRVLSSLLDKDGLVTKLKGELEDILPNKQESMKMGKSSKLMWPFKEKKAVAIIERLRGFYDDIAAALAIDSWNTLKQVDRGVEEIGQSVKEVTRGVKELKDVQEAGKKNKELREFLEWMNPVFCDDKHATCHSQQNPKTGRWIFEVDQYKSWKTLDYASLWLTGQPGHGKTILASSIIDDRTRDVATVLRSLVVQLLRQSKVNWITMICEPGMQEGEALISLRNIWQQQHRLQQPHPTDPELLRKLLVEASTLVRRPVLVIDALDECKSYLALAKHLVSLAEDARLRLFVAGRSEQSIKTVFRDIPTVSLEDRAQQIKEDINLHIIEHLETQERLSYLTEELKRTISEKLLEKAQGMFRWVQCQLDIIITCKRPTSILKALNDLPAGLDETYDRMVRSIGESGEDDDLIAQRCLLLVTGAFTPLTLDQLNEAMMIEVGQSSPHYNLDLRVTDPMDIVAACRGLVTYDEKTGIVALSHCSVKE